MNDLSGVETPMVFNGTGFGDPSASDGVIFNQASTSAILIGNDGDFDLGAENVDGFYTTLWLAFPAGYTSSAFAGVADHSAGAINAGQWGVDTGTSGTSLRCAVGRDSGVLQVGGTGDDIPVDEVFQLSFGYSTAGGNNTLTKYINGVAVATVSGVSSPLRTQAGVKVSMGEAGSAADQGLILYRALQEVTSVTSGGAAASGADIASRIQLDYTINKSRFTF